MGYLMVGALLFTYCSNENLIRDTYLRRNMDEQGWVPIHLIASFAKVSFLGNLWVLPVFAYVIVGPLIVGQLMVSSCFFLCESRIFEI